MSRRPLSVTIIAYIYIAAGVIGIVYHLREFRTLHPFPSDSLLVLLIRLVAIVSGVYMLCGLNWARWLALIWIGFHVVLSAFHPMGELVMHCLLLVVFTYFLFRPSASQYFQIAQNEKASACIVSVAARVPRSRGPRWRLRAYRQPVRNPG